MPEFHPSTPKRLREDLLASRFLRRPMPIHYDETREARCENKPVLKSRLLDDMESLENWEAQTLLTNTHPAPENVARIELSHDHFVDGTSSIKLTSPTNLKNWIGQEHAEHHGYHGGGIYCIPKAVRHFDHEDWREYNRISVWIYPDMPGFHNPCLRVQLHNEGEHPVPDVYDREGGHNINLRNQQWNHVTVEIPYTWRDNVTAITFDYDMVGHQPGTTDTACWYLDKLELQLVDEDHYEGWNVDKAKIAFSHCGYQPGAYKTAIASVLSSDTFSLYNASSGEEVLRKAVETVKTINGEYQIMNFTEITEEGEYYLVCGDKKTPMFAINNRVWMSSIWKMTNFFFCERCGYPVPGKHLICHDDHIATHGDKSVPANGGWHDAGDMHQQQPLTCEITTAMFQLAEAVREDDELLYERMLDEACWGLHFLLKTRFGDGYRVMRCGTSVWTDGIMGTDDDVLCEASNNAFSNLVSSAAEVAGYRALKDEDPNLAMYALQAAKEDFRFALAQDEAGDFHPEDDGTKGLSEMMTSRTLLSSSMVYAGTLIYNATGEQFFADVAVRYAKAIVGAQQTRYEPDWEQKLVGFFYRDDKKERILHYTHRSHEEKEIIALVELCKALPDHPDWMLWHSAILYHAKLIRETIQYTAPFGMLPSGVHDSDEIGDMRVLKLLHPIGGIGGTIEDQWKKALADYQKQLDQGVKIGPHQYVRRFPIWFSFRGNTAIQLALGKAVASASIYLNDYELYNIAQNQFQFVIGNNPFGQSIMYGEGYDYTQLYAVLPGDMVGALGVGMESFDDNDAPFWPQLNNCVYKEVWVASGKGWLWMMADEYMPARITAVFGANCHDSVLFRNTVTGADYRFALDGGVLHCELPAGIYTMQCGAQQRELTVVAGGVYHLRTPLASIKVEKEMLAENRVRLTVTETGDAEMALELRVRNLCADKLRAAIDPATKRAVFECTIEDVNEAWAAAVIPNGDMGEVASIVG